MVRMLSSKLKSRRGETLVESLVAILIASLGMVVLATAIATASNIIQTSKAKMAKYYDANEALTQFTGASTSGTVTVAGQSVNVTYYTNSEGRPTVVAYKKQ